MPRAGRLLCRDVHAASYGSYGAKRVHAELILGRGVSVGHNAVAMLMHRAGIAGPSGARKRWGIPSVATADDLVDRMFLCEREGRQYCCGLFLGRGLGVSAAWLYRFSTSLCGPCSARLFVAVAVCM